MNPSLKDVQKYLMKKIDKYTTKIHYTSPLARRGYTVVYDNNAGKSKRIQFITAKIKCLKRFLLTYYMADHPHDLKK